jgi:WD40 repeat protein
MAVQRAQCCWGCRYGLAWSPFLEGHLLSGSDDAQICLWDIRAISRGQRTLDARQIFHDHSGVVEVCDRWALPEPFCSLACAVLSSKVRLVCPEGVPLLLLAALC